MKKIHNLIEKLYNKKIDSTGLGVFRIGYGIILFLEIIHFIKYRALIYDTIPYLERTNFSTIIMLSIFLIATFFLIIGLFTRYTSILIYIFSIIIFNNSPNFEYHVFYAYISMNFLLMFLPIHKKLSIDNLLLKLKYSNTRIDFKPDTRVSSLSYLIPIMIGIALVYWGSIFFKFNSIMWLRGLGVWLPASLPQVTIFQDYWLLNNKYLMIFLGYLVLVFETMLIFLFWNKRLRFPLFILGVGFHTGIFLEFPIPYFAGSVIVLYVLLLPQGLWKKLNYFKLKTKKVIFYYDEECPLCNRVKIILSHFDIFNAIDYKGVQTYGFKHPKLQNIPQDELLDNIYSIDSKGKIRSGIDTYSYLFLFIPVFFPFGLLLKLPFVSHFAKYIYTYIANNREVERCTEENCGYSPPTYPIDIDDIKILKTLNIKKIKIYLISISLIIFIFMQFNADLDSPLLNKYSSKVFYSRIGLKLRLKKAHKKIAIFSKEFFGICVHGVFYDTHFENYNKIITIVYKGKEDTWLPIIKKTGQPGAYLKGTNWANWSFRVNSPNLNNTKLEKGIRRYTAYWAYNNKVDLNNAEFEIIVKEIDVPKKENWYWKKDYLKTQIEKPWKHYGTYFWKNKIGTFVNE